MTECPCYTADKKHQLGSKDTIFPKYTQQKSGEKRYFPIKRCSLGHGKHHFMTFSLIDLFNLDFSNKEQHTQTYREFLTALVTELRFL